MDIIGFKAKVDKVDLDKLEQHIKEIGTQSGAIGGVMAGMGTVGVGAMYGIVEASRETIRDMQRLEENAKNAGIGFDKAKESAKNFALVSGDLNSAVESTSNLLASGIPEEHIDKITAQLSGAAIKWSETLNTEGLADGLQESLAKGEAGGQFGEMLERSGVDLEKFNEKLAKSKKNGTELKTVMDEMERLGLAKITEGYKDANKEMLSYDEAQIMMQQSMADLSVAIAPLLTTISGLAVQFIDFIKDNPKLVAILGSIAVAFTAVGTAVMIIGGIISGLGAIMGVFSGVALGGLVASFAPIIAIIGVAIGAIALLKAYFSDPEGFKDKVKELWEGLVNLIKKVLTALWDFIKWIFTGILDAIVWAFNGVMDFLGNFFSKIGEIFVNFFTWYVETTKNNLNMAWEFIKGILTAIKDFFVNIFTTIRDVTLGIITWYIDKIIENFNILKNMITNVFTAIKDFIVLIFTTIRDFVISVVKWLVETNIKYYTLLWDTIQNIFTWIKDFIVSRLTMVRDVGLQIIGWFVENVIGKFTTFYNGVRDIVGRIPEMVKGFMNNMIDKIKSINLLQIGKDIINGLINGLMNRFEKVKEIAGNIASLIPKTVSKVLDIHSPSRVMAGLGDDTMDGLLLPLKLRQKEFRGTVEDSLNLRNLNTRNGSLTTGINTTNTATYGEINIQILESKNAKHTAKEIQNVLDKRKKGII